MPILPWRNDADGYAFDNLWTFDTAERRTLAALANSLVPAVVGAFIPLIPDPIVLSAVTAAAHGAAMYPTVGPLPEYGLCGGMAYTALDHWNVRTPIARGAHGADQPARTAPAPSALRNSIWLRLLDSLGLGGVLQRTLEWSLLLNQIPRQFSGGAEGLRDRTLVEWDLLRSRIDAGTPWPVGLVFSNRDVWDQHQILVYGYQITAPGQATMFVYDNNSPFQFGATSHHEVTLDFRGPTLTASGLSSKSAASTLAGFFCSNYFPSAPVGMAAAYGQFLTWMGDPRAWMVTDGARMPIAGVSELVALGGAVATVRATGISFDPALIARPRDGALFRERSSTAVFLYAGGSPFAVTDATWLDRFGGPGRVRVVPDGTISAFIGPPDEGTLLREWSDDKVYRMTSGVRRWVRNPDDEGGVVSVRVVPDGALAGIAVGPPIDPLPSWHWLNMGRPPSANIRALLGSVTVMDTPTSPQRPHVFVEGNDYNLWCYYSTGTAWQWTNMGKPPGVNIHGSVGAVTVMDTPTSAQRVHLFLTGNDGNLWCRWSTGTSWHWLNMGRPPSANIRALLGSVTVMDTPTSPQRPHVFVEGNDYNLWCYYSTGTAWQWTNMGKPPGVNIHGSVGAVTVMDTPTSAQRVHLFLTGNDGNLWCRWSTGTSWHWLNMGRPPSANIRALLGSVTVMDTPTSPQRPHVFVEGNDYNLWCRWSTGASWQWLNMGKPDRANITGSVGVISVMDTPTSAQRAHLFVTGNDGNHWCRYSTTSDWYWLNLGRPPSANIRGLLGSVAVMDTPTSVQRPHVFVEGNDNNLWCDWVG